MCLCCIVADYLDFLCALAPKCGGEANVCGVPVSTYASAQPQPCTNMVKNPRSSIVKYYTHTHTHTHTTTTTTTTITTSSSSTTTTTSTISVL